MKKGKIFLNEKNDIKIEIIRRTNKNYTHIVNIDAKIISITTWRKSKLKFRLNLITNILTLGILHICSLFSPKLYIKIYCKQSLPNNSDFFLVEDIYQNFTLCKTIYTKSSKRKISYSSNSQNEEEKKLNLIISFEYNSIKYKYEHESNSITPIYFNLSTYKNNTIVNSLSEGITSLDKYKSQLDKYGKNIMNLENKLLYENFMKSDLPQCISVFISGGICLICRVFAFGALLMFLSIITILIKIAYRYMKFVKKLGSDYSLDGINEYKVKRKYMKEKKINGYNLIKNIDLVPGDILSLNEGDIIPCDCILLEGECILNESKIIGKIDSSIRYGLEGNNNYFNYEKNKNNIAFHGSEILKIYSKDAYKSITALVINTGINTYKSNLLSNLLYKKIIHKKSKSLYRRILSKYYLLFMVLVYIASSTGIIIKYIVSGKKYPIYNHIVLNLGLISMPIYYIIICFIKHLGISLLNNENNQSIQCIDESKLIESGKINRVIFDKTGTITENNIEISAFFPLYFDYSSFKFYFKLFDKKNIKKINDEHLIFYRNYLLNKNLNGEFQNNQLNIQEDKNNLIDTINDKNIINVNNNYELSALFLQCLICCTNLAKINNEICGNLIEKEIIDLMKWDINTVELPSGNNEDSSSNISIVKDTENIIDKIHKIGSIFLDESNSTNINYNSTNIINEVFPKNYYKITEGMNINKYNNININKNIKNIFNETNQINQNKINKFNSFKIIIINRFFNNSYMNISCIVYNFIEDNYRFMTKGPPEKILKYCINNSLPDIEKILSKSLKEGYKIIACATKIIQYNQNDKNQKEEYYLKDLTFCGFIVFKNNLKEEAKQIIKNIKKMECDAAISTGDSLFNSLGTGLNCQLFNDKNIFSFDLNMNGKKSKILVSNICEIQRHKEKDSSIDIKSLQENINNSNKIITDKKNEIENTEDKSKLNNIINKKTLTKLKFPINNNSLINDIPSSSRQMIQNNESGINNNIHEVNKNDENESTSLERIDTSHFDEINNSPLSYYINEEENTNLNKVKTSLKYSNSILVNDYESLHKNLKNSISNKNNKKKNVRQINLKKINFFHEKKEMRFNEFHLDSYIHYHNISHKYTKKGNTNIMYNQINKLENLKDKISLKSPNKNNNINKQKNNEKINNSGMHKEFSYHKTNTINRKLIFEYSSDILKYFTGECTLCFSGKVLKYIYDKREKKEIKILLKLMNKYGRLFFSMTSYEKSLLIKINKELFNKKICMVGDGVNDIDAIISSNVGIYIGQQKNINTLLSHYFIDDNSLMNIETIIKNGRGYNENDILLLPANFIFTSCWVGLITYSYFLEKQVDNIMLTLLNLSIFILCVSAFSIQPDYKINFNYLVSNEKLLRNFKLFRFFGIFIIKIICQIFFYFTYDYNEIIDNDKNKEIILGYIFIMTWSQSMSSVLVFNISTFYRKSILSNLTFLLIYVLIFFYILYLLTLNDISLGQISIININFELSIKNIDFFDDNHKIIVLFIILSDIFIPCILVIVLKNIYEKKAQKYKVDNMEKNEIN